MSSKKRRPFCPGRNALCALGLCDPLLNILQGSQAGLMVPSSARELAEQQRLQTTPASRSRSRADSSPDVEQFQICRRCDKIYAERMNHRNACSWHRGVSQLCIHICLPAKMWGTYGENTYKCAKRILITPSIVIL